MPGLFTHALHSNTIFIFLRGGKTKAYLYSWEWNRWWWCIGRCSFYSSFCLFYLWLFFSSTLFSLFVFSGSSPFLFLSLFLFVYFSLSTSHMSLALRRTLFWNVDGQITTEERVVVEVVAFDDGCHDVVALLSWVCSWLLEFWRRFYSLSPLFHFASWFPLPAIYCLSLYEIFLACFYTSFFFVRLSLAFYKARESKWSR